MCVYVCIDTDTHWSLARRNLEVTIRMRMAFKKLLEKYLTAKLLKPKKTNQSLEPIPECPRKGSRRISLSDLNDSTTSSVVSDLSNSVLGSNLSVFTLEELKNITQNFSRNNFLGEGGFGRVYKGFIDDSFRPGLKAQPVAVKVLDLDGDQGHKEWLAEVIFLGQLKHPHLVKLIGYCCQDEQRSLVYEYMDRGNLDSKLFHNYTATLPWLTRLKIAIGAAKGLAFLHEEEEPIICRDVKASNMLLDTDYNAKISDLGLATEGPSETHEKTRVMGTYGYAAPEYLKTGHSTTMGDVYSFGVVLLELLTGRRSIEIHRPKREQNLVEWARPMLKDPNKLDRIMDPRLEDRYSKEGVRKAAQLAYQCLSHHPKSRPTMRAVVKTLEPLMDLNDIPVGYFVFVVPTEATKGTSVMMQASEKNDSACNEVRTCNMNEDRWNNKDKGIRQKHRKGHQTRKHQINPLNSCVVSSEDSALTQTLGARLYSSSD